jgi:hypothetical protein
VHSAASKKLLLNPKNNRAPSKQKWRGTVFAVARQQADSAETPVSTEDFSSKNFNFEPFLKLPTVVARTISGLNWSAC